MIYVVVLDFVACTVRKYQLDEEFENSSEKVEAFLLEQGLVPSQCEWMTSDEPIMEEVNGKIIK